MPKITNSSDYPPVTEVKENDILLGVQDGEVRQFPTSLVGGGGSSVYDLIIRRQAEFDALIADPTWFDAISVAFVGQFTISTPDNSGVKRPANVTRIDGYNNAKITITNFVYNPTTAKGGLWDNGNANNPRCYITDLTVDCTGTGAGTGTVYGFNGYNNTYTNCTGIGSNYLYGGYGFGGNSNTYTNCTGTGSDYIYGGFGFRGNYNTYTNCTGYGTGSAIGSGRGFDGSNSTYTNCTGTSTGIGKVYGFGGINSTYTNCTGTSTGTNIAYGFYGNNGAYTNCTGTSTGDENGYGFQGSNCTYTNCTGTGIGGNGYGFQGFNNRIISCTALAYIPTGSTPNDSNCVPIQNTSTHTNQFTIIRDCKFPQIAKSEYQQGTIWCNIANNTTMVGSIKDNVYHSRFTVAPIKGTNVVADNNSAVDITVI